MWDRGLHSSEMGRATRERAAAVLGRVGKAIVLAPEELLSDGSCLALVYPSPAHRRRRAGGIPVRVTDHAIDAPARPGREERDRLITSLLDPRACPAAILAAGYHQRWEAEGTAVEVKVHQADRRPAPHLRSRKPRGVVQEVYGLVLAHLAVRLTLDEAAARAGVAPARLSFSGTWRLLRRAVPRFQRGLATADLAPLGRAPADRGRRRAAPAPPRPLQPAGRQAHDVHLQAQPPHPRQPAQASPRPRNHPPPLAPLKCTVLRLGPVL